MAISNPISAIDNKTNAASILASVTQANKDISKIFGTNIQFKTSSFAGKAMFNANYITDFTAAIDRYRDGIQEIIGGFNPDANLDASLKGPANTAVRDFLTAFKALLQRYVQAIDLEKKEVTTASENWTRATGAIAGSVQEHTSQVTTKTGNIQLD